MNPKRNGYKPQYQKNPPRTPDPRTSRPVIDDELDWQKLHLKPCRFWKYGKCNWGWGCRFLHGNDLADDPRRPEYRGQAVDFTQFPRPISTSHYSPQIPVPSDDSSKGTPLRNPNVELIVSGKQSFPIATTIKNLCLQNNIDVLYFKSTPNDLFPQMSSEELQVKCENKSSDFILYVDFNNLTLYPDAVPINQQKLADVIHRRWNLVNNNLTADQIELLSSADIENYLTKLTSLENITSTVEEFQNDTANFLSSFSLEECCATTSQLQAFRGKMQIFFGRLNLANSVIAEMPLFSPQSSPPAGSILPGSVPPSNGLSFPMQRTLSFTLAAHLTQIHVCLMHVNKLLNEFTMAQSCYTTASVASVAMHPTPLCALPFSTMCNDDLQQLRIMNQDYHRSKLEMDVNVEMRARYSINFREQNAMYNNQFNQFPQ